MKTVAIIGAGPAGLSAAYELLSHSSEYQVTIYEKDASVGGLSKTIEFEGGRIDIGGHRFFTKSAEVANLWGHILPESDQGMLIRNRKSHILWNEKLINYPIELNIQTMQALGIIEGVKVATSYLHSKYRHIDINNLEDFYVNRFGRKLYSIFFQDYTYKLWGIPSDKLSPDWGIQRIQNVSFGKVLRSFFRFEEGKQSLERSFISQYNYPAFGAGQLWNAMADRVEELGGQLETSCNMACLIMNGTHISSLVYQSHGQSFKRTFDFIISSMPLNELIMSIDNAPTEIKEISQKLHYRDMVIIGIDLLEDSMGKVFQKAQKDSWLYMQDAAIPFGRIQILNNWSPYAVKNDGHILLELEYFCDKGDALWNSNENLLAEQSLSELIKCGICDCNAKICDFFVKRIEKAYPIYTDGYYQLSAIKDWIDGIDNLLCIGRNGQFRYNNMDHSAMTGIEAARSLMNREYDRKRIWNVNTDREYLEK